jgi:hypothetical protein
MVLESAKSRCKIISSENRKCTQQAKFIPEMHSASKAYTSFSEGFSPRSEDVERRFENLLSSLSAIFGRIYSSADIFSRK